MRDRIQRFQSMIVKHFLKNKQRKETKETKTNSKKPNRIKTRVKMQGKQDNIFKARQYFQRKL